MIQIHLDGKPVTKLQAARAAANLAGSFDYPVLPVGESDEGGWISSAVVVRGRQPERDGSGMRPATVSFPSIGSVPAAQARAFAEAVAVGAEIAELAEMLAAEQVTEFRTSSTGVTARCHQSGDHGPALEGATLDCDVAAHHEPAPSLVGRIVVDRNDNSAFPVTGRVVGQVDEDTVEVLWGEPQQGENLRQGTNEPVDALSPARICECGARVPEGAWADGYRTCRDHLSDIAEEPRFDSAAKQGAA